MYFILLLTLVYYIQTITFVVSKCMFIVSNFKKKQKFMNKVELINAIAVESGLNKAEARKALEAVVKSITAVLASGDKISLIGFGTFSVAERAARPGINPATKQAIQIAAKKVAKFKAGAELAAAIN